MQSAENDMRVYREKCTVQLYNITVTYSLLYSTVSCGFSERSVTEMLGNYKTTGTSLTLCKTRSEITILLTKYIASKINDTIDRLIIINPLNSVSIKNNHVKAFLYVKMYHINNSKNIE